MTLITTQCKRCGTTADVAAPSMFVEVDGPDADSEHHEGTVHWICATCSDLVSVPIRWTLLLAVISAGARLVEESDDDLLPAHPEAPADGAPFTADDVLEFHQLLSTDTWFDRLTSPSSPDHA